MSRLPAGAEIEFYKDPLGHKPYQLITLIHHGRCRMLFFMILSAPWCGILTDGNHLSVHTSLKGTLLRRTLT